MNSRLIQLPFDVALTPGQILTSGDLTCFCEAGRIRYLKFHDRQLLRLIYTAVRDKDWNTAEIVITNESAQQNNNGFTVSYTAAYQYAEATVFEAGIEIIAEGNTLKFSFKGWGVKTFYRNRIGICVLHPITECTGQTISITDSDGGIYTAVFPDTVSPHQPARNIRQMLWPVNNEHNAVLKFSGDIFEMEDQRNWTDDSYKTYSTPVDLPLPVQINQGDKVEQSVSLWFEPLEKYPEIQQLPGGHQQIAMPLIGYSRVPGHQLTTEEISLLKQIPFHQYRTELFTDSTGWENDLQEAVNEARFIGTKLELIVLMSKPVDGFAALISSHVEYIDSVMIVDAGNGKPSSELFEFAISSLGPLRPLIRIGYGTNNHFADLNRFPPVTVGYDFLSFGISPQAHASDTRTIIENLAAQSATINRIKGRMDNSAVIHVSPITLETRGRTEGSPYSVTPPDARFSTDFLTFWTLSALAGLEAQQVTIHNAVGESGILYNGDASSLFKALKKIRDFDPQWISKDFDGDKPAVIFKNAAGDELRFETDAAFAISPPGRGRGGF